MKLDNDLVRLMLLQIEEDVNGNTNYETQSYCENKFPDNEVNQTTYHMKYLIDAGFIQPCAGGFRDITPAGRDFLNNVRDNKVWADTKDVVKRLGTVAIGIVSEIAASIVKKKINIP